MSALVILGAGPIGAALAHQAMSAGIVRRIVLVDESGDVARGLALDIRQAAPIAGSSSAVEGGDDIGAVVGAPVVVLADRFGPGGEWHGDAGLATVAQVRKLNPSALIVCAGASQDALVEAFVTEHDADRTRIVGSAAEAFRGALTALTCLETGAASNDVSLAMIGRAPGELFVPWDGASIGGSRATDVLAAAVLARLDRQLPFLWPPGPLTLAGGALRVARLVLEHTPGWVCVTLMPPSTADVQPGAVALPAAASGGALTPQWPALAPRDQVRLESVLAV